MLCYEINKRYDNQTYSIRKLPSQKCHGPRLQRLAYHVMHPPQQSQTFDSKPDSMSRSEPKKNKTERDIALYMYR